MEPLLVPTQTKNAAAFIVFLFPALRGWVGIARGWWTGDWGWVGIGRWTGDWGWVGIGRWTGDWGWVGIGRNSVLFRRQNITDDAEQEDSKQKEIAKDRLTADSGMGRFSVSDSMMEYSPTASTWMDLIDKVIPVGYFSHNNTFYPWGVYKGPDGNWQPWGFLRSSEGNLRPWGFDYQNLTKPSEDNYGGTRFWSVHDGEVEPIGLFKSSNWHPNFHDCAIGKFPHSVHLSSFDLSLFETAEWRDNHITPRDIGMTSETTWESLKGCLVRQSGRWGYTEEQRRELLLQSIKVDEEQKLLAITFDTSSASLFRQLNATRGRALFNELVDMGFFATSSNTDKQTALDPVFLDLDLFSIEQDIVNTELFTANISLIMSLGLFRLSNETGTTPWLPMPLPLILTADDLARLSTAHEGIEADIQYSLDRNQTIVEPEEEKPTADSTAVAEQKKRVARKRAKTKKPDSWSATAMQQRSIPRLLVVYHNESAAEEGRRRLARKNKGKRDKLKRLIRRHRKLKRTHVDIIDLTVPSATVKKEPPPGASRVQKTEEDAPVDIDMEAMQDIQSAMDEICRGKRVAVCEEDQVVTVMGTLPNDPQLGEQWGLASSGVFEGWKITTGTSDRLPKGAVVAVLDTGIDYNHPDLKDNVWINEKELNGKPGKDNDDNGYVDDIYGYDFRNDDGDPMDDAGHGTHVSGIIGARGNNNRGVTGVAWKAQIMALKFLAADGSGLLSDAIEALEYAVNNGAQVTSNSWGGVRFSSALYSAVVANMKENLLFLCAAGNVGVDSDIVPDFPATFGLPSMLAITTHNEEGRLPRWASYGNDTIHLAAPGTNVLSTVPSFFNDSYIAANGSSMAVPHVAGAVALMLAANPDLSWAQQRQALLEGGTEMHEDDAQLTITGRRLNVSRSLQLAQGMKVLTYPATLSVPANQTVNLTIGINTSSAGQYGATVSIASNSSILSLSPSLRVTALSSPSIDPPLPQTFHLGTSALHVPGNTIHLPLTNNGSGVLAVEVVSIEGEGAKDFEVLPPAGMVMTVTAGHTSHNLKMRCIPTQSGTQSATLHLLTNEASTIGSDLKTARNVTLTCEGATYGVSPPIIRHRLLPNAANTHKIRIMNGDQDSPLQYHGQLIMDDDTSLIADYTVTHGDFFWFPSVERDDTNLTFDGAREAVVALPFAFPFYGNTYETIRVSRDGAIMLGTDGVIAGYASRKLGHKNDKKSAVYVHKSPHDVTIEFSHFRFARKGRITFRIVIEESGTIHLLFDDIRNISEVAFDSSSDKRVKMGIKGGTTRKYLTVAEQYPTKHSAVHFKPRRNSWISVQGTPFGSIPPSSQTEVEIHVTHVARQFDPSEVCPRNASVQCDMGGSGAFYVKTNDSSTRVPVEFSPLLPLPDRKHDCDGPSPPEGDENDNGGEASKEGTIIRASPLLQFDRYPGRALSGHNDFPVLRARMLSSLWTTINGFQMSVDERAHTQPLPRFVAPSLYVFIVLRLMSRAFVSALL
ncbi:unnamed protein product [Vitrella brassicaformis CCMP3155]|uniref:subtilisin n=1 Tax=Vitrella brassicaformis (strain CCMP3155) TaxID=1169540 RepID=A0A0G4GII0_VITBC|nr:unnamed protein product [Vitrella brassicaformis CCMP3155]|eukprot:CEM29633.1 unnamed protein product [Vitrella brassicaformis CCMP3155]